MLGPSYIEDRRLGKDFVSYYYAHLSLLFIILKDEYLASVKVDQKSNSLRDSSNSFLMNNNNTNKQ